MDDLARQRRKLIVQAAGIAAVLGAYMLFISRRARKQTPLLTVGRRIDMDIARESNLRYIYHSSDINCSNQLRMKKAPLEVECPGKTIDLESGETNGEGFLGAEAAFGIGGHGSDATTPSPSSGSNKKRKRASVLNDEGIDATQLSNMSDALRFVAGAINNTCHAETHPDLCKTIMALPNFEMDQKLAVLDYLTEHKGKGLNFMNMEDAVREAAFKRILAKNPDLV